MQFLPLTQRARPLRLFVLFRNMDLGLFMYVFLLLFRDQITVIFHLSGFCCIFVLGIGHRRKVGAGLASLGLNRSHIVHTEAGEEFGICCRGRTESSVVDVGRDDTLCPMFGIFEAERCRTYFKGLSFQDSVVQILFSWTQKYLKGWPKTSKGSPKDRDFTYFRGLGYTRGTQAVRPQSHDQEDSLVIQSYVVTP